MHKLIQIHDHAVEGFSSRVIALRYEDWDRPTPDADWDVRDLVNHLVYENLWAVPLLQGKTIAEVGDRFEGDLLGDAPTSKWEAAESAARRAVRKPGALDGVVHASFGDISAEEYVTQLAADHLIHSWDLARAVHGNERLDPDLVAFVTDYYTPRVHEWRAMGAFGPEVPAPPYADEQIRLLALTGREA